MFDHVAVVPYFANIGYFWCLIALITLSKPCVGLGVHLKAECTSDVSLSEAGGHMLMYCKVLLNQINKLS